MRKIIPLPWEKGKKGKVYDLNEAIYYHTINISDLEIVRLGYIVQQFLEPFILREIILDEIEIRCYKNWFNNCRYLIGLAGVFGSKHHPGLQEFFREDRELGVDDSYDFLRWITKEEYEKKSKRVEAEIEAEQKKDGSVEIIHHY